VTAAQDFTHPAELTDLEVAFGARAMDLMPPMSEIPDEFCNPNRRNKWLTIQRDWFFSGLRNVTWTPKPGIDQTAAIRHLKAIQGSWEPKHEHKEAAVAYLLSLWFDDVTYEVAK
jgi:hypothetical protein